MKPRRHYPHCNCHDCCRGRRRVYRRWLIVAALLAIGLVALAGITGCGRSALPTTATKPTLKAWIAASGVSMLPTFPASALVEVEFGVTYDQLKAGDTVIFWDYTATPARFIHHRLVARQAGNWIAEGDNKAATAPGYSQWVTPDNYIARTTGRYSLLLVAAPASP